MDLVTGGLGFIGNELVRQLRQADRDVAILDNRNRVAPRIDDIRDVPVHEVDIRNCDDVKALLIKVRPQRVFHLAAIHYIPECNANPEATIRVNVEGTLGLLRACVEAGVEHVLYASSGAVYADSPEALVERSPIDPVDIYGLSKQFGEQLCCWQASQAGMPVTACRFFNNYGPRETNDHIIPEIIKQLRCGDELQLGNTTTVRDYVHTSDTAEALRRLADVPPTLFRAINIAGGQSATVDELVSLLGGLLDRPLRVTTDTKRFRKADKQVQIANIDMLQRLTGWSPDRSLVDGLRDLLQFEGLLS